MAAKQFWQKWLFFFKDSIESRTFLSLWCIAKRLVIFDLVKSSYMCIICKTWSCETGSSIFRWKVIGNFVRIELHLSTANIPVVSNSGNSFPSHSGPWQPSFDRPTKVPGDISSQREGEGQPRGRGAYFRPKNCYFIPSIISCNRPIFICADTSNYH